ncbi:hypothetical protein EJ05DRAFT_480023 [Pseudovirgaria hyperparasitica]|uniref:Uncharacterized protein n=1 Tax=Pseudovirgaria hyperparasitica TaxID=470096 RepID=A0A6A6VW50_9PEZI|nr:uncharacterized protein EJ05DRAFT_480023 [Pseudovirgaria hyperparasitica]KAF2754016.1 hypothetical protein EJ05DRAFT_480023 [Pseudovirgaria hyperparasitica]
MSLSSLHAFSSHIDAAGLDTAIDASFLWPTSEDDDDATTLSESGRYYLPATVTTQ